MIIVSGYMLNDEWMNEWNWINWIDNKIENKNIYFLCILFIIKSIHKTIKLYGILWLQHSILIE